MSLISIHAIILHPWQLIVVVNNHSLSDVPFINGKYNYYKTSFNRLFSNGIISDDSISIIVVSI